MPPIPRRRTTAYLSAASLIDASLTPGAQRSTLRSTARSMTPDDGRDRDNCYAVNVGHFLDQEPWCVARNEACSPPAMTWPGGVCDSNGIRIHYLRTGVRKPPVVLLHGLIGSGACWTPLARALESDFDVVLPDARGHGESTQRPTTATATTITPAMLSVLSTGSSCRVPS